MSIADGFRLWIGRGLAEAALVLGVMLAFVVAGAGYYAVYRIVRFFRGMIR